MTFPANVASIRFKVDGLDAEYILEGWKGSEDINGIPVNIAVITSNDGNIDVEKFVHKTAQLSINCHSDNDPKAKEDARTIKGIVRRTEVHADEENQFLYTFVFSPSMWQASRDNKTRIFQKKSSKDIIKTVLELHGINAEFNLQTDPPEREYCVQYQESDLDFVTRLSEHDGYFFFIDQKEDKVQFTDDLSSLKETEPMKKFAWDPGEGFQQSVPETVFALDYAHSSVIKKAKVKDYNYLTPEDDLLKENQGPQNKALGERYNVYASHKNSSEGEDQAKIQVQGFQSDAKLLTLESNCRSASIGRKMSLKDYPGSGLNKSYIIRTANHYYEDHHYRNTLICMPEDTKYRPPRITPKPFITGVHTGVVSGPSGEKIYTDDKKLGRIKVRMNWDLSDTPPEEASCWMRIIREYAGKEWGHHFLPRIGDEVMVQFIDGDPDRPIVVGSVHHSSNMPPMNLPEDKFQNMVRTPFGHKFIFEDKEGSEKIELFTKDKKNYFKLDHSSGGHQIEMNCMEGKKDVYVKKDISTKTDQNWILETKDDVRIKADGNISVEARKNIDVKGYKKITIQGMGGGDIIIKQGAGNIKIDPIGNIEVNGLNVTLKASAIMTIQGSLVKIN
jgi:type VI secretion system secreted protein VgrG